MHVGISEPWHPDLTMLHAPCHPVTIDAEMILPVATVRVVRWQDATPPDHVVQPEHSLLDLCVTPRPFDARGCYHEQWGAHRFERLGDMLFIPAGHALHVRGDNCGPQGSIACLLNGDHINTWLETDIEWTDQRLYAALDIASITIRHLLRRLANEAANPGLGSRLLSEFLIGQLVIELGRYCEAIGDLPASGGLAAWRLRLIDERLKEHGEPPGLADLAALCRISVRQLTRGFRASRGCSIGDYVTHNRIENAKRLLDGDHPIKAVARAAGFASSSSFAGAFQSATGVTPRQFRQRILKAKLNAHTSSG
jgi:AraC family transcriptional regulator